MTFHLGYFNCPFCGSDEIECYQDHPEYDNGEYCHNCDSVLPDPDDEKGLEKGLKEFYGGGQEDPETRYWRNVATCAERFSYNDFGD